MSNETTADFADFFLADESTLEIELPNGEPMLYQGAPVTVTIHGPSTKEWAVAQAIREKAATARVFAGMGVKKKGKDNSPDAEKADTQFLVAITKRIDNFPFPGGIEAIYAERHLLYIANQVNAHAGSLGNFFKSSVPN